MKVLITGANGYLGRNLTKQFLIRGADVIEVVHTAGHGKIVCDLTNKDDVGSLFL